MQDKLRLWVESNRRVVFLALLGLLLIGGGIFWYRSGGGEVEGIQIIQEATKSANQTVSKKIKVDVEGAVETPGVYEVDVDTRVDEALRLAGGFSENADSNWIERSLNRAARLVDGQKIYIPRQGEEIKSQIPQLRQGFDGQANPNIISINTGSQVELESLPGIGPVTAGKIISARPYSGIEELVQKKIVGQKVYGQIKDKIGL